MDLRWHDWFILLQEFGYIWIEVSEDSIEKKFFKVDAQDLTFPDLASLKRQIVLKWTDADINDRGPLNASPLLALKNDQVYSLLQTEFAE